MYAAKVDYIRAGSVEEALSLLNEHDHAQLLAGGHSIIPQMKLRLADPGVLIDIGHIDSLKGIFINRGGGATIGALTTHAEVASSDSVPAGLAEAAAGIGDRQVRNRGTVGGNVVHADPGSDLPAILTALGARFNVVGQAGSRSIHADDFFIGLFETTLEKGEVLSTVDIPAQDSGTGTAYEKFANPASGYAMVSAGVFLRSKERQCSEARVVLGGLTHMPTRAHAVEAALVGQKLNHDTISAAAKNVAADLKGDLLGDIHASESYRKAMAEVYVKRALMRAAERARG